LREKYKNESGKVKICCGKRHKLLGMMLDCSEQGKVKVAFCLVYCCCQLFFVVRHFAAFLIVGPPLLVTYWVHIQLAG
ncbi:MAG: hypothetical protein AAF587_44880, partial [Bacteroidota bacterium]